MKIGDRQGNKKCKFVLLLLRRILLCQSERFSTRYLNKFESLDVLILKSMLNISLLFFLFLLFFSLFQFVLEYSDSPIA